MRNVHSKTYKHLASRGKAQTEMYQISKQGSSVCLANNNDATMLLYYLVNQALECYSLIRGLYMRSYTATKLRYTKNKT